MDPERHEEIARGLFRESNDAFFLFDPEEHRVLDLNPVALRLTGFTKDQARSLGVWDLFSGDSQGALDRLIDAYRRTGFYHSREGFRLARRDGKSIPVNVSVSRIHTRPTPMGLVVARDVSDRKRNEEALRESEQRYRGLVETAQVVFWTTDAEGRITSLNPRYAAITGFAIEDRLGLPLVESVAPEDAEAASEMLTRARTGAASRATDLRIPTARGSPAILEFLANPAGLAEAEGGVSGIARDVTEARFAADAVRRAEGLERAKLAAELADRAKTEFLAQFSHEIRTPMTSILGYTDILLTDPDVAALPSSPRDDLRIIKQSGAHLLAIINDILDLSEIEAGKLHVEPRPCSVSRVAREVIAALAVGAQEKGLTLAAGRQTPIPETIRTDPLRFRQILMNLVGNALKFTDRGGVTVGLATVTGSAGSELRVSVEDTGMGMTGEQMSRLFEPFYRPSGSPAGGTGLGLAISRKLAERLGGRIDVESQPGRGTTFRVFLPLTAEDLATPSESRDGPSREEVPTPPPTPAPIPSGTRILLAEDNPAIQRVTAMHLQRLGAEVEAARNGQEALDVALDAEAGGTPFDVILMDMQMPVMDGYEATRLLRDSGFAGVIVALTAYAMAEDREECLRLGCDEHVSKPVDWERLGGRIAELLNHGRPAGVSP